MNKRCMGCMELYGEEFDVCPHCGYVDGTEAEEALHMEPGTILNDRYIVGKVLGYGGFGVTYIGWDGTLEQKVAIKEYLPSEFSTRMPGQSRVSVFSGDRNEQFYAGLDKFVEEAKRLAKFQSEPGIVKIYNSFRDNDTAYIVMEYLEGETLTQRLKREKTIPENEAVELMMPVMKSLQVVHESGILHRDIAPDNIFITKSGEVKLIDFGASRYATTSYSRSLTVIIKPGYSPEEQYRSRGDQGAYTDVYALSATLYKMITGKTPPDAMQRRAMYEDKNKDILEEPHTFIKDLSVNRENAILNGMNVRIEDRTPDVATLMEEINADPPAKRRAGRIRKIDVFAWPLWVKILVPSLLAVAVTFATLLGTGVIKFDAFGPLGGIPEGCVQVPNVENVKAEEAIEKIEKEQLLAVAVGNVQSDFVEAGVIIIQNPSGGSVVSINSEIELVVSGGGAVEEAKDGKSTVPYIIWDTKETAIEKLKQAGLGEPKIKTQSDEHVEEGKVISMNVKPGEKLPEGSQIEIIISTGPAPFDMINVVNKDLKSAKSALESKGLVVTVSYAKNDSVPEGNVISQSVSAGTKIKKGSEVTITVSSGKNIINIANVTGVSEADAKNSLKAQGFKVEVIENYHTSVSEGKVIEQSPKAGTGAIKGDTVIIYVSKGKQPVNIKFDANGGTVTPGSATVYLSANYGTLPNPQRTHYTFAGWYTAPSGGSRVTSGSMVTRADDHTLYAHWSQNPVKVTFNANGGSVSTSSEIYDMPGTYSGLPTPKRDYYNFAGWYTAASGGTKVSNGTTISNKADHTLYAHWTQKPVSGWTLASNVPSGAQIVNTKWTYDYTTTKTSSNPNEPGYTCYKSTWYWGSYGAWSGWSRTPVSGSDSRQVETNYHPAVMKTQYNYSRYKGNGRYGPTEGTWGGVYCGTYQELGWRDSKLPIFGSENSNQAGFFYKYNTSNDPWYNETTRQVTVSEAYTEYRYRDRSKVYTYYHKKVESKESYSEVANGGSISNVQKYVQYRAK